MQPYTPPPVSVKQNFQEQRYRVELSTHSDHPRTDPFKPVVNNVTTGIYPVDKRTLLLNSSLTDKQKTFVEITEEKKAICDELENYYEKHRMYREMKRFEECHEHFEFYINDKGLKKINKVWFCKHKFCPICQERRVKNYNRKFNYNLNNICKEHNIKKPKLISLTLTEKNFNVNSVDEWLTSVNQAFSRWMRTKEFKKSFLGAVRVYEFTQDKKGLCHAHVHMLILVDYNEYNPSSETWHTQEDFQRMWKHYRGFKYNPVVHVQFAKDNNKGNNCIESAAKEAFKYTLKPQDLNKLTRVDNDFLAILTKKTYRRRFVLCTGLLKSVLKDIEEEEFNYDDEVEIEDEEFIPVGIVYATWDKSTKHYYMRCHKHRSYIPELKKHYEWISTKVYVNKFVNRLNI